MKDYKSAEAMGSHYSCPSMYGKMVKEQYNMQPKYGDGASKTDGKMNHGLQGKKSNKQVGP